MWAYDPKTKTSLDGYDILRRTDVEEAADRLWRAGIRNQRLLVDILSTLSRLERDEITFTLQVCYPRVT